jgi:hypothetical protein
LARAAVKAHPRHQGEAQACPRRLRLMLELPDVTLVAVFTVAHALTLRAVEDCTRVANFGAVRLFTDREIGRERIQAGPFANLIEAGRFSTYEMPKHVTTSHILNIHYDSWILDPSAWRSEFLDVDYLGAIWYWHPENRRVGNSGFCIRSKRLLDFLASNEDQFPIGDPEDLILCRDYRPRLEKRGFNWGSETLAAQFSFERSRTASKTFGYHGLYNWPSFLSDEEIEERLAGAPVYVTESQHYREMRDIMDRRSRREVLPRHSARKLP